VILVIGQEIAEVLAPFAKWGAIVGGALTLIGLTVWYIRSGGAARKEREIKDDLEEERQNATEDYLKARRRVRAAAIRGWLRNRQDRSDPAPGEGDRDRSGHGGGGDAPARPEDADG